MTSRRIAVCEKESYLTAGLERRFLGRREWVFRWFPCRQDFFAAVSQQTFDLALFDCDDVSTLDLAKLKTVSTQLNILAILPRDDFELEFLLRELGVRSVLSRLNGMSQVANSVAQLLHCDESNDPVR